MQGLQEEDDALSPFALPCSRYACTRTRYHTLCAGNPRTISLILLTLVAHGHYGRLFFGPPSARHPETDSHLAWCDREVVTKGWKTRTDNKCAVYRGVRELSVEDGVRGYGIRRHRVYCHYPREVVRIPEPTEDRMVILLDGFGVEGQPPKVEAAAIRVNGVRQETESAVAKMVYGAASHAEVQAVADVVGKIGEDVREGWMVVDAETSQQAAA